ncbi:MAG: signal peptide peptidase SppA [Dehalococcoidales bacterium]|nr:signal peptide peptidase SppA [Dehalococcoidales bacterium]
MSRNKIIAISIAGVIVVSIIVLVWAGLGRAIITGFRAKVAVIPLTGTIQESGSLLAPSGITPDQVRRLLERAERDGSIKAVVLRINSLGGAAAASQEISDMIKGFKKPIVVSMGDMAISGGYYISAHADMIVAQPGTLTGSIGVIWMHTNLDGLCEKLGIEMEAITSGEHKDMFIKRLTPERRDIIQRILDEAYDQFIRTVAEGRGLTHSEVRELATGEPYIGTQALALGLVDRLGGQKDAIDAATELAGIDKPIVVRLAPSPFELFFAQGGSTLMELAIAKLLGEEIALLRAVLNTYSVPWY